MFVEYKGNTYMVKFDHITEGGYTLPEEEEDEVVHFIPRQTVCSIYKKEGTEKGQEGFEFVASGPALVHPNDRHFIKEIGRQVSLGRALQELIPREDRKLFWRAYSTWGREGREPRIPNLD